MNTILPAASLLSAPIPGEVKKKRVLLVDTSQAKRELRAEVMRKFGMDVDCTADVDIGGDMRLALAADRGDPTQQRWGILEASRRISAVPSKSLARTQAMRAFPDLPRDSEGRPSKRTATVTRLDDLLTEELR
jgi:hypothetical protein